MEKKHQHFDGIHKEKYTDLPARCVSLPQGICLIGGLVLCSHAPSDIQQLVIESYPPGNQHIPPWEKENHLQNAIFWGYVSSLEGIFKAYYGCHKFTRCRKLIGVEPP